MKYSEVKFYLDSFINYERTPFFSYRKSLKLERVRHLMSTLGIPYRRLKAIHIAGTKGKGSTATFCAYILAASGYTVGLYTSPHFFDFRERVRIVKSCKSHIVSNLISKKELIRIVEQLKPTLDRLRYTERWGRLTFFEVYTAIAFKCFSDHNLDFVVLETGLGGRLDATNIINPLITIITHIGYDHMSKLGKRLKDIAYEKAGIIKKCTPVVTVDQRRCVLDVIRRRAKECNADLFILGKDFDYHNTRPKANYTFFDFSFGKHKLPDLKILPKGIHQVENVSLALGSLCVLQREGMIKKNLGVRKGLENCFIEGRFEIVSVRPLIILDIAHNSSSFCALSKALHTYFPNKRIILIFSASKDKDVKNMLNKIKFSKIIITSFNNPRSLSPEEIRRIVRLEGALIVPNLKEAFRLSLDLYEENSLVLVAGSLFLIAEMKKIIKNNLKWEEKPFTH